MSARDRSRELDPTATEPSAPPFHELFPPDDGDEPADITFIRVQRHDPARPDDKNWPTFARTFKPEELPNLAAIYARWGGGTYHLSTRMMQNRHFGPNVTVTLAGPSKPFQDEPDPSTAATIAPPPYHASQAAPGGLDAGSIMGLLMAQQSQSQQMMLGVVGSMTQAFASLAGARPAPSSDGSRIVEILAKQGADDRAATLAMLARLAERTAAAPPERDRGGGLAQGFELGQLAALAAQGSGPSTTDQLLVTLMQTFAEAQARNAPAPVAPPPPPLPSLTE